MATLPDIPITELMTRFAAALALILFGVIAGILTEKIVRRLLHSLELDKVLVNVGLKFPLEEFISSIAKYVVYFAGIIYALYKLGLSTVIVEIILGVIIVLLVTFIILAFKDFIPNITAGLSVRGRGAIKKGDFIKINNIEGQVIEFDLIEAKLKLKSGDVMIIPNSFLSKNIIVRKKA